MELSLRRRIWQEFYEEKFGVDPQRVPQVLAIPNSELIFPIPVVKEVGVGLVIQELTQSNENHLRWNYPLRAGVFPQRDRPIGSYVVYARANAGSDIGFESRSVSWALKNKVRVMTLKERLLFELYRRYMDEPRLDSDTWTLCSDVLESGQDIPAVGWEDGSFCVKPISISFASHLHRIREVLLQPRIKPPPP